MKVAFSTLLVAYHALSAVCAAPSFVSKFEDDGMSLSQSRKQGGSIAERLRNDKRFTRFMEILEKERGLTDELESRERTTTVFAPTNDAFKRMEKEWEGRNSEEGKPDFMDAIRYHIAPDSQISEDCLHAGALIPTGLRLKSLDSRHQRMRVFKFNHNIWLNMNARIVDSDMAENGYIHVIDNVLLPPTGAIEMLYAVPTSFSTTLAALERTGLACDLNSKERAITIFAPSNDAWQSLGFQNLMYLFSCAGQKEERGRANTCDENKRRQPWCRGTEDLKRIMQFHVATQLAYSTDMMKKETMKMKTMEGSQMTVCAKRREDEGRNKWDDDSKHQDVRKFNFVVNNGEARIQFTDGLAANGAIQVLDNVMIPQGMKLPNDRM